MIEFKPSESEKIFELLGKDHINDNYIAYTAFEGGEEVGNCVCFYEDTFVKIIFLDFSDSKPYIGEGLIKSALNFAAGKGAYIAVCSADVKGNHPLPFGFNFTNGEYTGEIPEILMGKCHKFGNL